MAEAVEAKKQKRQQSHRNSKGDRGSRDGLFHSTMQSIGTALSTSRWYPHTTRALDEDTGELTIRHLVQHGLLMESPDDEFDGRSTASGHALQLLIALDVTSSRDSRIGGLPKLGTKTACT